METSVGHNKFDIMLQFTASEDKITDKLQLKFTTLTPVESAIQSSCKQLKMIIRLMDKHYALRVYVLPF